MDGAWLLANVGSLLTNNFAIKGTIHMMVETKQNGCPK
jgi:hypothetical protein